MKLQGFELEVEGSREDAALISNQVGKQISGMLDLEEIIQGKSNPKVTPPHIIEQPEKKPRKRKNCSSIRQIR